MSDTLKCRLFLALSEQEPDDAVWPEYNSQALIIARNNLPNKNTSLHKIFTGYLAHALLNVGYLMQVNSKYDSALVVYEKVKSLADEINDLDMSSSALNNSGAIYHVHGNYLMALKYYADALKIMERQNNLSGVSTALNNIGNIYSSIKENRTAITYLKRSLDIKRKLKLDKDIAQSCNNIALAYSYLFKPDSAKLYYEMGLSELKTPVDPNVEAALNSGLGQYYATKSNHKMALDYFRHSLVIRLKTQNLNQIGNGYFQVGNLFLETKQLDSAQHYLQKAYLISKEKKLNTLTQLVAGGLSEVYSLKNQFPEAFKYLKEFKALSDISLNSETKKAGIQQSMKYEFEKKEAISKLEQEKKDALTKEKNQKQQYIIIGISLLLLCVIALAAFAYRSFLQKKKSNIIISKQKELVEEKQKEIIDSINYAKRIQSTLLTHEDFIGEHLAENFILYKPKDIVSGDFYWATSVVNNWSTGLGDKQQISELFYFAVCDSTGHGVPGAFMSLLNIGFLSEAINEKKILEPNKVFDYVRDRLTNSISKEGQKDGFDGILICIEKTEGTTKISYAAANNAPLLISNGHALELPKDKMPVGKGEKQQTFTLHQLKFNPGDKLFLYTDGFADQFGGEKGKKFKYKPLNELLLATAQSSSKSQKEKLEYAFNSWMGDLEQVDDVLIAGIVL